MEGGCQFFQPIRTVQYFKSCYLSALNFHAQVNSTGSGLVGRHALAKLAASSIEEKPFCQKRGFSFHGTNPRADYY